MRISIGHRLFASVLLAILAVAATGILLMRQNVMRSFSEYATNIELDRLEDLSLSLARQYESHSGWNFLPSDAEGRRAWIAAELARLQQERLEPPAPIPPVAPVSAPESPVPAEAARIPAPHRESGAAGSTVDAPVPPVPPLPPLRVPVAPPVPPVPPMPPAPTLVSDVDHLGLQERVTVFDASGAYLAGRLPGSELRAQRPIVADRRTVGQLAVARVMRPSDALAAAFLGQLGTSLWAIVAASVALSAIAATLLAAHFRKPIGRLADGARALADGRFDTRLPADRSDELGELAHSFNQLAQRLGAMEDSRRQWVADTSHELRTPLSVLRAQLEAIQDGVRKADAGTVAAMHAQVLALNKLIDQLYALARADVGALDSQRVPTDLWALAREQAAAFGEKLAAAELSLEIGEAPSPTTVLADPDRMRQVFANLFENSVRYTSAGGRLALNAQINAQTQSAPVIVGWAPPTRSSRELAVIVDDSAPGVPDEALTRLSERFYRIDASRSRAQGGAGLGLALCQRMIEAQGGRIEFAHSPLGGLRVTITLPLESA